MNNRSNVTLSSVEIVKKALTDKGLSCSIKEFSSSTRTAQEAAVSIGCTVGQIVKSLIFKTATTDQPVLVLTSGINKVNEATITHQVKEKILRADADFVRKTTGFAIGGIPPIGHHHALSFIFIDQELLTHELLWAAAGTPHTVFSLTPQELLLITQGKVIAVV